MISSTIITPYLFVITLCVLYKPTSAENECEQIEFYAGQRVNETSDIVEWLEYVPSVTGYEECADRCCAADGCNVVVVSSTLDPMAFECELYSWDEYGILDDALGQADNDTDVITALLKRAHTDRSTTESPQTPKGEQTQATEEYNKDMPPLTHDDKDFDETPPKWLSDVSESDNSTTTTSGDDNEFAETEKTTESDEQWTKMTTTEPEETFSTTTIGSTRGTVETEGTTKDHDYEYGEITPMTQEDADLDRINAIADGGDILDKVNQTHMSEVEVWFSGPEELLNELRTRNDSFSLICMFITGLGLCVAGILIILFAVHMREKRNAYQPLNP